MKEIEEKEDELSLLKRHLNWTWFLTVLLLGVVIRILIETIDNEALTTLVWIIGVIGAFLITLWVLKEKQRNWWYAFTIFIPFIGWLIFLTLGNWSKVIDIADEEGIKELEPKNEKSND
ncbi:MAG: hypothetical protein ABID87_06550 [Chloroflexota bacterium]